MPETKAPAAWPPDDDPDQNARGRGFGTGGIDEHGTREAIKRALAEED